MVFLTILKIKENPTIKPIEVNLRFEWPRGVWGHYSKLLSLMIMENYVFTD